MGSLNWVPAMMTARAFLLARIRQSRFANRSEFERWQQKRLNTFLRRNAHKVSAFAHLKGKAFLDYPIMDKSILMDNFERYNRLKLTTEEGWAAFNNGVSPKGYHVGASTGTSGNRGLYLVSDHERYLWLGTILAKALPFFYRTRHRIAVVLPANSSLYDAANETHHLRLKFFSLTQGIDPVLPAVETFNPTVIIAPPKVLRALAEAELKLKPKHVFSGAEVLDPMDRIIIESFFTLKVREIYMATEGLLAVGCSEGSLHLAEDCVAFEWGNDPSGGPLKMPIITDFTRQNQLMIRYKMNDLLELSDKPCPCGSPFQVVKRIIGRLDDMFELKSRLKAENLVRITPDVIRNAVLQSDPTIHDFRVIQTGADSVTLALPTGAIEPAARAKEGLNRLFQNAGAAPQISIINKPLIAPDKTKLRRVMKQWNGAC